MPNFYNCEAVSWAELYCGALDFLQFKELELYWGAVFLRLEEYYWWSVFFTDNFLECIFKAAVKVNAARKN